METTTKRRGRPTSSTSKRQKQLAAREALIASGVTIKRGRPAKDPSTMVAKVKKAKKQKEPVLEVTMTSETVNGPTE